MRIFAIVVALLAGISPAFAQQASHDIAVTDAWARATAGTGTTGGAYLTLTNKSSGAERVVSASSPVAGMVELHTTIMEGDVMKMRPVPSIDLAPGAKVELKPGGMHIMLIGLKAPLKEGDSFPLTLTTASGKSVTVDVPVRSPGAMGSNSMAPGGLSHTKH